MARRSDLEGLRDDGGGGAAARISSLWSRGRNPGSMDVPPTTRIEEASVWRRSKGTFVGG